MSNANGAIGQNGETPAASPAEVITPPASGVQEPSAGTLNAEPEIPYHELIKRPGFKEFYERQKAQEVEREIHLRLQSVAPNATPAEKKDEMDEIVKEMAEENGIDPKQMRKFVDRMNVINEKRTASQTKALRDDLEGVKMTLRFGALFAEHKDAGLYQGKMQEIFPALTEIQRQFVLTDPEGPAWLLDKARKAANGGLSTPAQKHAGASPAPRSPNPAIKTGGALPWLGKAQEAALKGDRKGYEEAMANHYKQT